MVYMWVRIGILVVVIAAVVLAAIWFVGGHPRPHQRLSALTNYSKRIVDGNNRVEDLRLVDTASIRAHEVSRG